MVLYLHHVPGRMRVRVAALKRNEQAVVPLRSLLLDAPGVQSATVNSWTGSVTVHYDPVNFEPEAVWSILRRLGHVDRAPRHASAEQEAIGPLASAATAAITDALAAAALEHLFGRSAGAFIRLLI